MNFHQWFKQLTHVKLVSISGGVALLFMATVVASGVVLVTKPSPDTDVALTAVAAAPERTNHKEKSSAEAKGDVLPDADATLAENLEPEKSADFEADTIAILRAELTEARTHGQMLQRDLDRLETAFAELEQRVARLNNERQAAVAEQDERSATAAANGIRSVDTASFVTAGFDIVEAERLAQRWGEAEMEQLYLRDQAIREGWINTPRYREAVNELQQTYSLASELDTDAYDRFLFATGQPNRVSVSGIIEGSPAQLVGLQPGDVIMSYDGAPVRSGNDLRDAISTGAIDELVLVEVDRGGQPIDIELPRCPIEIRMESLSIAP